MNKKELMEYLKQFSDNDEVSFIIANRDTRLVFPVQDVKGIIKDKDWYTPCLIISVGEGEPIEE